MKARLLTTLKEIAQAKKDEGFQIIDTHVHPLDVMGIVHHTETQKNYKKTNFTRPTIMERLRYGRIEKIGTGIFFKLFPRVVGKIIESNYKEVHNDRVLEEMDLSLVDKIVLLPVEPFVPTEQVCKTYTNTEKFINLASIDIHNIKKTDIKPTILHCKNNYGVPGIKLHPNIQNFLPLPEDNPKDLQDKLEEIYSVAEENNLYLLFHGGTSFFTNHINNKYGAIQRSSTNSLLNNFVKNKNDSLFNRYKTNFVIAHIGHYGLTYYDKENLKSLDKFKNVYFDTSGISPYLIKNYLNDFGDQNLLFGSDGLYNKMSFNLAFLYWAIQKSKLKNKTISFANISSRNYLNNVIKIT
jgi:predicted TIM-barrel fold metal-dependent hydrolase